MIETTVVTNPVGHDHIEVLVFELAERILADVFGFRCESDRERCIVECGYGGENVRRPDEVDAREHVADLGTVARR